MPRCKRKGQPAKNVSAAVLEGMRVDVAAENARAGYQRYEIWVMTQADGLFTVEVYECPRPAA